MTETIKDIGVVLGVILSSITFAGILIKPIRKKIVGLVRNESKVETTDKLIVELKDSFDRFSTDVRSDIAELKEDSELNKSANKCILSNRIIYAYEKYKDAPTLDASEVDSLIEHYNLCKRLGTNGKIDFRYNELMKKDIH